jgi:O-acetylserine/cysteine efflux transporter
VSPSHLLIALAVMFVWGTNFVAIRLALDVIPAPVLTTLRFVLASVPLIFFLPRPRVPWRILIGYALSSFSFQFTLLFVAIEAGMPAGLASLVVQCQVFFTIVFAVLLHNERPLALQWLGVALGGIGILVVALQFQSHAPIIALLLTLAAAVAWSVGNLFVKRMGAVQPLALVAWGSGLAAIPLLPFSLWASGPGAWVVAGQALGQPNLSLWACLAYNVLGASLLGYGGWSWLLRHHPASQVAPFTLLVPVFGLGACAVLLQEVIEPVTWAGIALVFAGLAMTQVRLSPAR